MTSDTRLPHVDPADDTAAMRSDIRHLGELLGATLVRQDSAELLALVEDETINGKIAKDVFADVIATGKSPRDIVAQKGLAQVKDSSAIEQTVRDVVTKHPKELASFKGGKASVKGFFVGQIMRALKGANPAVVNEVLDRVLAEP